ncbi:ABC transporter permease [Actinomadura fibrosa]|uniref:FtsX-like permease family protein n=1 Tax=Actinomadura fibrosa TaxID=111802 RepID=A0ABW2XAK7_9ACTN|nr:ABC transporter permease [Actinomadura fibrosa]
MSALGKVVRAGVGRRRVQTVVTVLTTMMAVTASVLAAGLIVESSGPFDRAFARQHGAHLAVRFDGAKATPAQLAATARVRGVTAAAGPGRVFSLRPRPEGAPEGADIPPLTVAERAAAGGSVDVLDVTQGRWAAAAGEMVAAANTPFRVGDTLAFPDAPGRPRLTVVGKARSVGRTADAWVAPAQAAALVPPGTAPAYQMLYRFAAADTDAQVAADRAAVTAAVPPGSVTAAGSYRTARHLVTRESAVYVPFVVAFGVLGLCMSVLVISVVVSGAVGSATRRIGILKSLGFTPAQVVRAYVAQAVIPAAVGTILGTVCGNLLAIPALHHEGDAFDTGTDATVPLWIDIAVPAAALAVVAVTALVPALRAGRLRAIEATVLGRAPRAGRGRAVRRLLGRLPLPRPVSMGLATPFAHPARSAGMVAGVVLGTVGITFGLGLGLSLDRIDAGLERRSPGAVEAHTMGRPEPGAPPKAADPDAVARAIAAQPGTRRYVRITRSEVGVAGLSGSVAVSAYSGDASWASYEMISGRWFTGPGEAVVPSGFLKTTGTRLGDTVTLTNGARHVTLRLVGEALDLSDEGRSVLTDARSLTALGLRTDTPMTRFAIDLAPGTDARSYADGLDRVLRPIGGGAEPDEQESSPVVIAMDSLIGMLTLLLAAVAGLGVLNAIVLDTRERVHDLGVLKALGMSPRQTVAMVITSVAGIGLVAGAIGVPLGVAVHSAVLPSMGDAAGTRMPSSVLAVYDAPLVAPLLLGGVAIAVLGALLPAGWAARTRTATALRTE